MCRLQLCRGRDGYNCRMYLASEHWQVHKVYNCARNSSNYWLYGSALELCSAPGSAHYRSQQLKGNYFKVVLSYFCHLNFYFQQHMLLKKEFENGTYKL